MTLFHNQMDRLLWATKNPLYKRAETKHPVLLFLERLLIEWPWVRNPPRTPHKPAP